MMMIMMMMMMIIMMMMMIPDNANDAGDIRKVLGVALVSASITENLILMP